MCKEAISRHLNKTSMIALSYRHAILEFVDTKYTGPLRLASISHGMGSVETVLDLFSVGMCTVMLLGLVQ